MRVEKHPILGDLPDQKRVTLYYNGQPLEAYEGEPVASALMNAGIRVFRTTARRAQRYLLCYRAVHRLYDDCGWSSQYQNLCHLCARWNAGGEAGGSFCLKD